MNTKNHRIIQAKDLRRGMIVLPFMGVTFQRSLDSLDWTDTLYKDNWQHTVIATDNDTVTFARPYVYAHEHFDSNSPLIGCEVYKVCKDSTNLYMLIRYGMTT